MDTLTSVRIAGEWHAIYPRARRTLCLIVGEQALHAIGRRYADLPILHPGFPRDGAHDARIDPSTLDGRQGFEGSCTTRAVAHPLWPE